MNEWWFILRLLWWLYEHNSKELSIPLLLYNDDCETVNPLGSKCIVHKWGLIYLQYTIKCLPPPMPLSSLSSCFLLAVYKWVDAEIWHWFCSTECCGNVKISVAQVCGGNWGLNSLLGCSESFTANHCCRWCKVHKEDMWSQTWKTQRCCALDLASNNQSETGIKRKCALDELKYFSVVDYVAHHAQHSWGNWTLWCQVGLGTLSGWRACELETLNYRLTNFIYGFPDSYKHTVQGRHEL